ncbi:hypothetical protein D3C84_810310 [compost metagenome]
MTTDADLATLQVVQAREQGDQRRLASAVGSQQRGETSGRQAETHLLEGFARTIGKAQVADLQGVHGVTTTPQG